MKPFIKREKLYIQVALRITEKSTKEREFGNLLAIKDSYPKYVITLDEYEGASEQGIKTYPYVGFSQESRMKLGVNNCKNKMTQTF